MFPHIGMIRRALIGQIQCDVEPQAFSRGYKPAKIVQRAKLRLDSLMSTLLGTNRPRASRFSRLSFPRVVFAFAMCAPDRMDWRKVKDVEPHFSNFRNDPLTILERPAGARKHFVPGTEPCANRIDSNPQPANGRCRAPPWKFPSTVRRPRAGIARRTPARRAHRRICLLRLQPFRPEPA